MIAMMSMASAFAGDTCDRVPVPSAALERGDANGLAVERVQGAVRLVPSDDDQVHLSGTACAQGKFKLVRRDGVIVATERVPSDAGLELTVAVPKGLASVSVHGTTGAVSSEGVDARLAVVSGEGPVAVRGARSLRVAFGSGPIAADSLQGDLVVDHWDGALQATAVDGDVTANGLTGPVTVDDVDGDLAVGAGGGPVSQTNVRGLVTLP